jgi:hypothetical protein
VTKFSRSLRDALALDAERLGKTEIVPMPIATYEDERAALLVTLRLLRYLEMRDLVAVQLLRPRGFM